MAKFNRTRAQRRVLKSLGLKACRLCDQDKLFSSFAKCRSRHDGLDATCRDCNRARRNTPAKKERARQSRRRYRENNRDRENTGARERYDPKKESLRNKRRRQENPEALRESSRKWRDANRQKANEMARASKLSNPEKLGAQRRVYRETHKEQIAQRDREYRAINADVLKTKATEYRRNNSGKVNARTAKRNAAKLRAIPAWANLKAIAAIYAESARLTKETGIPHEVDHIYPLQSKWMCGLHVETNLQILQRSPNRSKSNNYWPGREWSVGDGIPC